MPLYFWLAAFTGKWGVSIVVFVVFSVAVILLQAQTRKAEERRRKIERLSVQIMKTLAGTIDAKDKYTNGHSLRVAEYSREIMRRLGGTKQEQDDVYVSRMHMSEPTGPGLIS